MTNSTATRAVTGTVHQLKLTLEGLRPPIWRRVLVPSDIALGRLHDIIQLAMGWHDSHLHEFSIGERRFGPSVLLKDLGFRSERTARLGKLAPHPKDRLRYQYDFGDSWDHLILVEAVLPRDPTIRYPVCTAGRRACPPEDCGGVWGYVNLLDALLDPEHPEHQELKEWAGPIDPEHFDLAEVNSRLGAALGR